MGFDLKKIQLIVMDFDGVHTDGYVYVDQHGNETVRCSRRDGLGLDMVRALGIKMYVISKEKNPVVIARCKKLGIDCSTGVDDGADKLAILRTLVEHEGLTAAEVAYIGDDVNDIEPLEYAGVAVTVADGHERVKKIADIVLTRKGGEHALREFCDRILEIHGA